MGRSANVGREERVLALVALSSDAALTRTFLEDAGFTCTLCSSLSMLCEELEMGAGALLINEEALLGGGSARLMRALGAQPVWSDVPVLLLTGRGADTEAVAHAVTTLPNVTVLERPVRIVTLVSALRTALIARRRQYEIRDYVRALAKSEASYRAMFEATTVGVVEIDLVTDRFTRVNAAMCRLTGYSQAQLLARGFRDIAHADDVPPGGAFPQPGDDNTSHNDTVKRYVRSDGETFWGLVATSTIRDANGHALRNIGVIVDITERKRAEEALAEANRRKSEFLAILAHELRNPLTPIRTGLDVLRLAQPGSPVAQEARELMERQVVRMVRLIGDLVDVARITRGAIALQKERVDIAQVIRQAIEETRSAIDEARHVLSVTLPDEAIRVEGDPVRLAQVLSNVLGNATRYTPAEGRIAIAARREGAEAVVSVTDNGIGIPRDMLEQIFEFFAQVDVGFSRSHGGLGVGLGLARAIIELHGGAIQAHSAGPGGGSTFTVRLPLAEDEVHKVPAPGKRPRRAQRPLRVLVVDDQHEVAMTTEILLRLMGHETRIVHDGPSALEAARVARPDLVLLDLGMPEMDGYAVARALRERRGCADVPIVAVSGYGGEADLQQSKAMGFSGHLVKPFERKALEAVLDALSTSAAEPGLSFPRPAPEPGRARRKAPPA